MTVDRFGYVQIRRPEHPRAGRNGQVLQHIVVMEKMLGRYLKPGEVVHHSDGNRKNNRPSNLRLFASNGEHAKFHAAERHKRLGIDRRIEQIKTFNGVKTVSEMAVELGITVDQCRHTVQDYNLLYKRVAGTGGEKAKPVKVNMNILARRLFRLQRKYYEALAAIERMDHLCTPYLGDSSVFYRSRKYRHWRLEIVRKKWESFRHT